MKAHKKMNTAIAVVIIIIIMSPAVYYFIRFNEKGYIEQKLLERYIEQKKREDIVLQTGARTKLMDVDVSFKNIRKEDIGKIKAGDKELLPDKSASAEILWVGDPKPNYFLVDVGPVNKTILARTNAENELFSIPAKIRIKGVVAAIGNLIYKDVNIKDLAIFKFRCDKYEALFAVEIKE